MIVDYFQQLQWREPLWLLLILQPTLLYIASRIWTRNQLTSYADKPLLPWLLVTKNVNANQWRARKIAFNIAWVLFVIGAAGPRTAVDYLQSDASRELDIAVVVDVSKSMHTTDVYPNRLQRAKQEVLDLLERLHNQRIAVILFSAKPHLYVPLTNDYQALRFYLESLDKMVLPSAGSQLPDALALAVNELNHSQRQKAIILLSDGDFGQNNSYKNIADQFRNSDIKLAILGIGTIEGDVIPLSGGGWLYQEGKAVISRLQESVLQQLARSIGGYYTKAEDRIDDWKLLYDNGIAKDQNTPADSKDANNIVWHELYQWPLIPALLLFFWTAIPIRFTRKSQTAVNMFVLLALGYTLLGFNSVNAQSDYDIQAAFAHYNHQDYVAAAEYFANIPGYQGRVGEGASRYRLQDYNSAIESFTQAVLDADNDQDVAVALYNLGNSYFQAGNYARAVQVYKDVLRYRDQHEATIHNLAISNSLKQLVEKRSRITAITERAGRGPRQALAQQNLPLSESDSVTLDQSTDSSPKPQPDPALVHLDHEQLEFLIQKGLAFVHVLTSDSTSNVEILWRPKETENLLLDKEMTSDNLKLWRRLFEIEEGFPAPLDAPVVQRGIAPW